MREMTKGIAATALLVTATAASAATPEYRDGRPAATLRMDAKDHGIVLRYGDGPEKCDILGARDPWVFEDGGTYEKSNKTWFLFTNHIGIDHTGGEFTDAIWVYWSKDLNNWDPKNKAVVLDGRNCSWAKKCIGLPSVVQVGNRLALFYDAPGGRQHGPYETPHRPGLAGSAAFATCRLLAA